MSEQQVRIGIIGLGYVGLPLAVAFARQYDVLGYDHSRERITQLQQGEDRTLEVSADELAQARRLTLSHEAAGLAQCNVCIVTVPTPIDEHKRPDMSALESASRIVGQQLKRGDVVIYESTVYPGATEEVCVPILERHSGLVFNRDFFCGYSPERVNPGDKQHRLEDIRKVTSGSTPEVAQRVNDLYASIIRAGTYMASSIRVAEAAKVIENTQRDLNIALINELAIIFSRMGLDTGEVLQAAATKWNFLPFKPGLVGGHCIGVDPYYLTHKAQALGYHPEIILAGRRLNDSMGHHVVTELIKRMARQGMPIKGARVLVMGLTFKENCPDLRNTKVVDIVRELSDFGVQVDVVDPWADPAQAMHEYALNMTQEPARGGYDAVVIAVAHQDYQQMQESGFRALCKPGGILYDLKHVLPIGQADMRL
jgi:UDP-N-acetyl-D-galactosamine dehydrogenase